MNNIMQFENTLTMSSREIASVVDSRHDDVKRSIERLSEKGVISLPPLAEVKIQRERRVETIAVYKLDKRASLIVVAQLCPEFTARIVDRWQELEEKAAAPLHLIPQTLPEALRLAADLADQRDQAVARLMIAAPKVEAFDLLKNADGLVCVRDAAKILQVSERKVLIPWLLVHRWMYRRQVSNKLVGYQDKCVIGYLEHKCTTTTRGDGSEKEVAQVLITPKGMARLAEIFSNASQAELFAA